MSRTTLSTLSRKKRVGKSQHYATKLLVLLSLVVTIGIGYILTSDIRNYSTTSYLIDTNNLQAGLIHWKSKQLKKTVCTTAPNIYPAPTLRRIFQNIPEWKFVVDNKKNSRACASSMIRILWDDRGNHPEQRQQIENHQKGKQLTTDLSGSFCSKSTLKQIIDREATTDSILREIFPETRFFSSIKECVAFCNDENDLSKWIWKPKHSAKGKGITSVAEGGKDGCILKCKESDGNISIQILKDTMLMGDESGRKFDLRAHLLVANLDPLIVYSGAERVSICAEPRNKKNPLKFPGSSKNSLFNPFQHVCNNAIGMKHPHWSIKRNNAGIADAISNKQLRTKVQQEINSILVELVNLFVKTQKWHGEIGQFILFGIDFLVEPNGKLTLLEMNSQPGFKGAFDHRYPNPWYDILNIEWTILTKIGTVESTSESKPYVFDVNNLGKHLENIDLKTLHPLIIAGKEV